MNKFVVFTCMFTTSAFLIFSCEKNKEANNDIVVTLYNCSNNEPNTVEPYICFDSLLTDSRCPIGAQCPWSGTAIIKVSFHETVTTHQFKMTPLHVASVGFVSDTTINGYRIVFTDLQPYPDSNKPQPLPGEIKATFKITH